MSLVELGPQDLRRSNFTSADCRRCNFKDSNLQGAYFIKAVVPYANFEVSTCIVYVAEQAN